MTQQRHEQLLDEAVDAYVDWREESTEVWDAYERWRRAPAADAPFAFSAYCAAVDREKRASRVYAELMTRPRPLAIIVGPAPPCRDGATEVPAIASVEPHSST